MDDKFYRLDTWNTIYEYIESQFFWKMSALYDDKDNFVYDGFVTMLGFGDTASEHQEELKTEISKCDDGLKELFMSALLKKSYSNKKHEMVSKDDIPMDVYSIDYI